jgi:hypothetical protein
MSNTTRFFLCLCLCLNLAASELRFELIECRETPVMPWRLIETSAGPNGFPASGGTATVQVLCYSGVAYALSASGVTNRVLVEASTNLVDWQPYPAPGFQLTFFSNSPPFTNVAEDRVLFFRGIEAPL